MICPVAISLLIASILRRPGAGDWPFKVKWRFNSIHCWQARQCATPPRTSRLDCLMSTTEIIQPNGGQSMAWNCGDSVTVGSQMSKQFTTNSQRMGQMNDFFFLFPFPAVALISPQNELRAVRSWLAVRLGLPGRQGTDPGFHPLAEGRGRLRCDRGQNCKTVGLITNNSSLQET